ncbi:transcriptional repressor TCF25-domain-containing protein [Chytriomyces sp. MP71]|nr:transcriptional repressor TCF25-domain-containing protein [Chytriomyces sp. MP71]
MADGDEDEDEAEVAAEEEGEQPSASTEEKQVSASPESLRKTINKRNKKKKAKRAAAEHQASAGTEAGPKMKNLDESEFDEIDRAIQEVNARLGEMHVSEATACLANTSVPRQRHILYVDLKALDADAELRKSFGSKVLAEALGEAKKGKQRNRNHLILAAMGYGAKSYLTHPKDGWPRIPSKTGISMTMLRSPSKPGEEASPGYFEFTFSLAYLEIQTMFMHCVSTHDPNTITNLLHAYPYHIDALLQKSEIAKQNGDINTAAEYVERALYLFERSFHPLFNMALANSNLPYAYPQNRAFFLALSRHISFTARKGCWRTCLELSKLLLALDEEDPLGALQMMDWFAIKAGERAWMKRCWVEWGGDKGEVEGLPNWSFSIALAGFDDENAAKQSHEDSTLRLKTAITQFPQFVPLLLAKLTLTDPIITTHPIFAPEPNPTKSEGAINLLVTLYVERCHHVWKEPSTLSWLRETARAIAQGTEASSKHFEAARERNQKAYPDGLPLNVSRHIFVSDFTTLVPLLPDKARALPLNAFDPMPPPEEDAGDGGGASGGFMTGSVGWVMDQLRNLIAGGAGGAEPNENAETDTELAEEGSSDEESEEIM